MGIKSPIHIKILNDTLDIVTLMTHGQTHCRRRNKKSVAKIWRFEIFLLILPRITTMKPDRNYEQCYWKKPERTT